MAEAGARVTLVDYSASALDSAKRRFERLGLAAEFQHRDFLADSPTLAETFHVASSLGVIEHFRGADRLRTVRAHGQVLQPGGLAVISVPNASCPPYRLWKLYLECRGWWPYGMEIPYSRGELRRLCLKAGFERVETHGAGFWQSVADHWVKRLASWAPDWSASRSMLDPWMGLILLAVARKPGRCSVRDEVRSA
jgi:cyclopropane fatty-acyl-phospholipid synthase-like methyltransferase